MTSMASLSRLCRIALAALLALAVASAWSTGGSMAMSPMMHVHAGADAGYAHSPSTSADAGHTAHAHSPATTAQANPFHDPAAEGCCVMTVCHPAIPATPVEVEHAAANGLPAPVRLLHPAGNEPSPALPPPRNSLV